jgi:hypothetical protein
MVVRLKNEKVAKKIIDLLADSRILPSEWKYFISSHIVLGNKQVIYNAKNLADGINYNLDRYGIDIPADVMIAYPEDKQENVNGRIGK